MSLFDLFKVKCRICGLPGVDKIVKVPYHGHYRSSTKTWNYHDRCLETVLGNPELYGHQAVDIAIEITERILQQKKDEAIHEQWLQRQRVEQLEKVGELKIKFLGVPKH